MKHSILVHDKQDDVGVAVEDLQAGLEVGAATLEGESMGSLKVAEAVPLGHKIALHDLPADKHVIEYGSAIGRATASIPAGAHVHVHNLKSLRW
jgi:(2R)-sulfolactate sulfo-lyase subunit alpha